MTDYQTDLEPCPECGSILCDCEQHGREQESDAEKLRILAGWFDTQTEAGLWNNDNRDVQEDLLRIAELLETYHKALIAVMGASSLRRAWQVAEEGLKS